MYRWSGLNINGGSESEILDLGRLIKLSMVQKKIWHQTATIGYLVYILSPKSLWLHVTSHLVKVCTWSVFMK